MENPTSNSVHATQQPAAPFPPLEQVTKPNLKTSEAAFYLNRATQTLNIWACRSGTGPMVPKRIGGRLAWSTAEVKALAGVTA
jgi:hypothetical protein